MPRGIPGRLTGPRSRRPAVASIRFPAAGEQNMPWMAAKVQAFWPFLSRWPSAPWPRSAVRACPVWGSPTNGRVPPSAEDCPGSGGAWVEACEPRSPRRSRCWWIWRVAAAFFRCTRIARIGVDDLNPEMAFAALGVAALGERRRPAGGGPGWDGRQPPGLTWRLSELFQWRRSARADDFRRFAGCPE